MAKKIKLELTEKEMSALVNIIDCASSALEMVDGIPEDVKKVDGMLNKNGYKRNFK